MNDQKVKWSTGVFMVSIGWLAFSCWRGPVFVSYLIAAGALGLLYGTIVVLAQLNKVRLLQYFIAVIPILGERVARSSFVPNIENMSDDIFLFSQFLAVMLISALGLTWLLRQRLRNLDTPLSLTAAEQSLGADSPVSDLYS